MRTEYVVLFEVVSSIGLKRETLRQPLTEGTSPTQGGESVGSPWVPEAPQATQHRQEIAVLLSSNLRIKILIRSLAISGLNLGLCFCYSSVLSLLSACDPCTCLRQSDGGRESPLACRQIFGQVL